MECEAYGNKVNDSNIIQLPRVKADKNTKNGNPDILQRYQQAVKVIDNDFDFSFRQSSYSCAGALHEQESRISVYFDKVYEVINIIISQSFKKCIFYHYILFCLISYFTFSAAIAGSFISVEHSSRHPERQICGQVAENSKEYFPAIYLTCTKKLYGDRVSIYRSGNDRRLYICEILVFGKDSFQKQTSIKLKKIIICKKF